jgi:hypothetical protein
MVATAVNAHHRAAVTAYAGSGYVLGDLVCASAFVKANGYNFVKMGGFFGNESALYNLSTGTVVSTDANVVSAKIEDYGNGWYRITNVYTFQNTITNGLLYWQLTPAPTASTVYTGDGVSGCYAWGGQVEKNVSYPTSYIPTTTTSVTRVADVASKTGISSLIGQTEGTLFVELDIQNLTGEYRRIIAVSDGTNDNVIQLVLNGSGGLEAYIDASGIRSVIYFGPTLSTGIQKLAITYKTNEAKVYRNGVLLTTDTSVVVPACSSFYLGKIPTSSAAGIISNGIKQALIFPTALTATQLAELTTI